MKKIILVATVFIIGAVLIFIYKNQIALAPEDAVPTNLVPGKITDSTDTIFDKTRVTKKPFGIYIVPKNSPVQPEKFTGYHTGADFETTATEINVDIPVPVFCDGKLLLKKYATGYGGVAVQSCNLNGESVTVIYGHLKLQSINPVVGQSLKKGDLLGILGKGYSPETDGERKHLHLGIHSGSTINIFGYVQKQSDLSVWEDPLQFLE
ncbi:MAG: M23 family metallopeptidase [bacterium]|nr:M23 family metallopeptidase [bacterium]